MSSVSLIREPAWSGLAPGLPQTVPAEPAEAALLLRLLGLSGRLSGLRFAGAASGHYKLVTVDGEALHLKVVEPSRRSSVERAEAIAEWLARKGLAVATPSAGFPRTLPDGRLVTCCPYIEGRRIAPKPADLAALGRSVALLHAALASHPDRNHWVRSTRCRLDALTEIGRELAAGRLSCGPDHELLRALASDEALRFDLPDAATPLHGDLNPGNVLVAQSTDRPVLLDFEDVFHSVLPPMFELLLVIERFVFVQTEDDKRALRLARAFLDGYCSDGASIPTKDAPSTMLRALSLRSLCVLAQGAREGVGVAPLEWKKFFYLERQARRRAGVLNQVFAT